jgi:hypothetical protein
MTRVLYKYVTFYGVLSLMMFSHLLGDENVADRVGLQIANDLETQIDMMDEAQEELINEEKNNGKKNLDYEVVPPEMNPKPYLGVFGILVSPQVSISIPALVTLRIAPQLDIYWGRFMPAGMTNYIPTVRVIKPEGNAVEQ